MSTLLYILAFVGAAIVWVWFKSTQPRRVMDRLQKQFGDRVFCDFIPLIGSLASFAKNLEEHNDGYYMHKQAMRKNPNIEVFVTNFSCKNTYMFVAPHLLREMLNVQHLYEKSVPGVVMQTWLMEGLLMSPEDKWKPQRHLLSKSFHFEELRSRFSLVKQVTHRVVAVEARKYALSGEPLPAVNTCESVTSDVVVKSFFGQDFKDVVVNGKPIAFEMTSLIAESFDLLTQRIVPGLRSLILPRDKTMKWLLTGEEKALVARAKEVQRVCAEAVDARIADQSTQHEDFLQVLIRAYREGKTTKSEILAQFMTFFFAGTDTTGHLGAMMLYALSLHPDVQEKLYNEARANLPAEWDKIEFNDLKKLTYAECVINETLRMYPPAGMLNPRYALKTHRIGEYVVQEGDTASGLLIANMFNPKYFPEPEKFNPERWATKSAVEGIDPHAFLPFSAGPHNCIGQHLAIIEAKVLLSAFVLNYRIVRNESEKLRMSMRLLYGPVDQKLVKLQVRE